MDISIPFLALTNYTFSISEVLAVFLFFYCLGFVIAFVTFYYFIKGEDERHIVLWIFFSIFWFVTLFMVGPAVDEYEHEQKDKISELTNEVEKLKKQKRRTGKR